MKIRVTLVFNLKHDNIGKIKMQVKTLLKFENVPKKIFFLNSSFC